MESLVFIDIASLLCYNAVNKKGGIKVTKNPFQKEIAYREILREKRAAGEKLSPEEVLWEETHAKFSSRFGYPYLMKDVIDLEKDVSYQFHVSFLKATHPLRIEPWFFAPEYCGEIATEVELIDSHGRKSRGKTVRLLVTQIDEEHKDFYFCYHSELGKLCVSFSSEKYEHGAMIGNSSHNNDWDNYMIRKDIAGGKIVYHCSANGIDTKFDSLVFLVEWNTIER